LFFSFVSFFFFFFFFREHPFLIGMWHNSILHGIVVTKYVLPSPYTALNVQVHFTRNERPSNAESPNSASPRPAAAAACYPNPNSMPQMGALE